jgi:hypothetical protein
MNIHKPPVVHVHFGTHAHALHELSFEAAKISFALRHGGKTELTPSEIAMGLLEGYREAKDRLRKAEEKGEWDHKPEPDNPT